MDAKKPLVAIVGPTASGKTAMSIKLAKLHKGEIICADSRTVYQGLNISTAKPTTAEMQSIKHHLLDIVEPNQVLSVAQFKQAAQKKIKQIWSEKKLPMIVGGSGLFVDSVVYDFSFNSKPDVNVRQELSNKTTKQLQEIIKQLGIEMPNNKQNPRHLIRAIETGGKKPAKKNKSDQTLIIGINISKKDLDEKISKRAHKMVENGLIDEIKIVTEKYGWDHQALQTPAFKAFKDYFSGKISQKEAIDKFIVQDRQLAKRQLTWLKRNNDIRWVDDFEQANKLVSELLSNSLLQ